MSDDLYRHCSPGLTDEQSRNLLTLAKYLARNAEQIDARKGLLFGYPTMRRFRPLPCDVVAAGEIALPALGYGPHAGLAPHAGDNWRTYCAKVFGIHYGEGLIDWLQSEPWAMTEPSTIGVALRIAYVIDFGIPHDSREIAKGEAHTDYDTSGFMWDRLDMLPTNLTADGKDFVPLAKWPAWKPVS